jgi:hypothetical protein
MIKCTKCGGLKPPSEYHSNGRGGLNTQCKSCYNASRKANNKAYKQSKAGKKSTCQSNIRRKCDPDFTISDIDWDSHWNATECALCGKPLPIGTDFDKQFDHDHNTGAYRGTLCSQCNVHLGVYEKMLTNPRLDDYLGGTL